MAGKGPAGPGGAQSPIPEGLVGAALRHPQPGQAGLELEGRYHRHGAAVYEKTPVAGVTRRRGRIGLHTRAGKARADKIVMATSTRPHFFPQLRTKQLPVWPHIVLTEPIEKDAFAAIGWQNRQGIEDARNLAHYDRLTADNRLLTRTREAGAAFIAPASGL